MPKAITLEMLHAMSPDQRKTLHANATGMDTPASRAVLELLQQDGLMPAAKVAKAPAKRAPAARKMTTRTAKTAAEPKPKTKTASFGRQA